MRAPQIYYVWFVTESGFVQTHQVVAKRIQVVERYLERGLRDADELSVGAAVLTVALDDSERVVLSVTTRYNRSVSGGFRDHIERRALQYRPGPRRRASRRRLPPGREGG